MCGCECFISIKIIHSSLLSWRDWYLKILQDKPKMLKKEGLVKNHIVYMKHIEIHWYHIDFIFMPKHQIWQRLPCVHIFSLIVHFHTGNMYFDAVLTVQVSIFLTKKQIISIQTQHHQLGWTFITSLRVVLLMVEFHWKTIKYVICVKNNLYQTNLQYIHQKRISYDGDRNFLFSYQFLYSSHPKVGLSTTTCGHTWYKPLWWNATHILQTPWTISRCSMLSWLFW